MTDPTALSLMQLAAAYRTGGLDPVTAVEAYLDRIAARNPALNAYIAVFDAAARTAAVASADRWRQGRALGPLDGAPIALKDIIDLAGTETANGCAFGPVAKVDAQAARRLKAAGAIVLGKLNQHELALGAVTDNPHWGSTHNPYRTGVTPGGSSGGSGAAVAARLAVATLGTDTMGSVRIPAAYCGVYGLKPSYGLTPTRGVAPLAWSLDHVGPLARTPDDLAAMLEAMAGHDPASAESRVVRLDRRPATLAGLKVGRLAAAEPASEPEVREAYVALLDRCVALGARIVALEWPGVAFDKGRRAGLLTAEAEAAEVYRDDLTARPERFSDGVRAMLTYGATAPAPKLAAARREIWQVRRSVERSFADVDVIALPASPAAPFPFDGPHPADQANFAAPANFAGCPAIAFPGGATQSGLPIGMQFFGPVGADFRLCRLAAEFAA